MDNNNVSFFEKTAFNYNSSFQDKKTIATLKKEIELLKAELEKERQLNNDDNIKVISTVEDFARIIGERLSIEDRLKLVNSLNQAIKKQQSHIKPNRDLYQIAKRIFKSRPAKKVALINSIKTMFQDEMTEDEIERIIIDLQKLNFIKMKENMLV